MREPGTAADAGVDRTGEGPCVLTVGLTGGIASGKSTVDAMFEELGARVIDADRIVHALLGPGGGAARPVIQAFGAQVAAPGGGVDRATLGAIVFASPDERARLEKLIHPMVREEISRRIEAIRLAGGAAIVIVDAALLVETGSHALYDRLIVVTCREDVQVERLVAARGLTRGQALGRVRAQASSEAKAARADYRIPNDGTRAETRAKVEEVYRALLADHERKRSSWNPTAGS
jgi:dephospho-CoA kinase